MVVRTFTEDRKLFEKAMKFGSAFAMGQVVLDHAGRRRKTGWRLVSEAAARNKLRRHHWGWECEVYLAAPGGLAELANSAGCFVPSAACLIAYSRPNSRHVIAFLLPRHDEILPMLEERRELEESALPIKSGTNQLVSGARL